MRKSLALTISLIIMCLFAVGCSQNELKPNDSIATEISKIQNTEKGISLDSYADSWDNVLIDSSYDIKTAVENLNCRLQVLTIHWSLLLSKIIQLPNTL